MANPWGPAGGPANHRGPYSGDNAKGCWLWTGGVERSPNGMAYGKVQHSGRTRQVHRAVFEAIFGFTPNLVLHSCDEQLCYRPEHMSDGDAKANALDMLAKGRHHNAAKTECPQGHPYDDQNTYIVPATGHRQCRACARERRAA